MDPIFISGFFGRSNGEAIRSEPENPESKSISSSRITDCWLSKSGVRVENISGVSLL